MEIRTAKIVDVMTPVEALAMLDLMIEDAQARSKCVKVRDIRG